MRSLTGALRAGAAAWAAVLVITASAIAEAPTDWLRTEGKSEAWLTETAKIRELLGRLDPAKKAIQRWIPAAKRRCEVISRMNTIGFRQRLTYVDHTEVLLEDLAAGEPPYRRYAGKYIAFGYWSDHTRSLQANEIVVPPGYDPAKEYQLFIYYKMGGDWIIDGKKKEVRAPWRPSHQMCLKAPGTFHSWSHHSSQLKGRMGSEVEVAEFPAALAREFSVSVDRVFMSGFSDGGYTPLFVGSRWPHLLAGIAPEVANWQYYNSEQVGLLNLPVLHVDGWMDSGFVDENFVRFHALRNMGADIEGLWAHHGHATKPYEDEEEFLKIMAWAKTRRRNPRPKRVRYSTWNLRWHRAYWVTVERMADPRLGALVDVQVKEGNRIEVRSKNVARLRLGLSAGLVDMNRPVTVTAGGRELYSGPAKAEIVLDVVKLPESKYYKEPASHGGITAAMESSTYGTKGFLKVPSKRWTWVRGTGGTDADRSALKAAAPKWAKDDTALTDAEKKTNLFVYGGPLRNGLLAPFAAELPVACEAGRFTVGTRAYDGPGHCVKFIFPNPHNPAAWMIVYAFNDPAEARKKKFHGMTKESSWGFRLGDCRVYGVETPAGADFGVHEPDRYREDVYVFDSTWRATPGETVGTAAEEFDQFALLRLRADAMREAAGADAAVVMGLPPGFSIWKRRLPKGPVTLHDIAVTSMFPDYIMKCEVTGAQLRGLAARSLATTVLRSRSDPGYGAGESVVLGEIDDARTYTLVWDYCSHNSFGYHAKFKEMPKYFHFREPEDIVKQPHIDLKCRKLVQTEIETTEAVAGYFRRHKTVSPRAVSGSLIHYLIAPRRHHLAAYDWAHVAAAKSYPEPGGAERTRKVTFNLALKRKGEPPAAPPRENCRTFHKLDLAGAGAVTAEFGTLGKGLPVRMTMEEVKRFAVAKEGGRHVLAAKAEAPVAELHLLKLTVTSSADSDLDGMLLLGSTTIGGHYDGTWRGPRKMPKRWYCGFAKVYGPRRKESRAEGVLLIYPGQYRELERIMVPGAGYGRGTIAGRMSVELKPRETLTIPVLFFKYDGPAGKRLSLDEVGAVLEEVKAQLLAAAK